MIQSVMFVTSVSTHLPEFVYLSKCIDLSSDIFGEPGCSVRVLACPHTCILTRYYHAKPTLDKCLLMETIVIDLFLQILQLFCIIKC
jgi:hypothetical protein